MEKENSKVSLQFNIGKDEFGNMITSNFDETKHLLIAGKSGSGKSVFMHNIISDLVKNYSPDDVKLLLIDTKKVEFTIYKNIPHLLDSKIITDCDEAANKIFSICGEIVENKNNPEWNKNKPQLVIVIDEVAELLLLNNFEFIFKGFISLIQNLDIHLIIATQNPDIISKDIIDNFKTKIAFKLDANSSQKIIGVKDASSLNNSGDMIYKFGNGFNTLKLHSTYYSEEEILNNIKFCFANRDRNNDDSANEISYQSKQANNELSNNLIENDKFIIPAIKICIITGNASASILQRKLQIGYSRAAKIIDYLENKGYISKMNEDRTRQILITYEKFKEEFGEDIDE